MRLFLLAALTTGCPSTGKDDSATPTPNTETDTDTDADADSDADADADSDADSDADTDTDPPDSATVGLDFTGSIDGAGWAITRVDLTSELSAAELLVEGPVTGTHVDITPPEPPSSALFEVPDYPDLYAAYYVPAQFDDVDGDGSRAADEVWTGVGNTWALYLAGTVPAELATLGLAEGWNGITLDFSGAEPTFVDPLHIPVPTNLLAAETLLFGGTYSGSSDADANRLFLLPYVSFEGTMVDTILYDDQLAGSWTISLAGAPPADHFTDLNGAGLISDLELPLAYVDADGSGAFEGTETMIGGACTPDGQPVAAFWLPPPDDLSFAISYAINGFSVGWSLVGVGKGLLFVDPAEWTQLDVDEGCLLF